MAEGTRSRSKSEKSNTSATEVQSIPLNLVKEMLSWHNFRTGVYLFMHAAPLYSEDNTFAPMKSLNRLA